MAENAAGVNPEFRSCEIGKSALSLPRIMIPKRLRIDWPNCRQVECEQQEFIKLAPGLAQKAGAPITQRVARPRTGSRKRRSR